MAAPPSASPTRSTDYYFEDGTVVLRVDNMLYKVYRGALVRKSKVLKKTLAERVDCSGSSGSTTDEELSAVAVGSDDELPVVLDGVTTTQWNAFLWSIFAGFDELEQHHLAPTTLDKLTKLLDVAFVARKFECLSLRSWSIRNASVVVSKLSELEKSLPFTAADLLPVVRAFAALHDLDLPRSDFLDWVEPFIFKDRYFSASHHVAVLRIAAETGWQALERNAYYRIVCASAAVWDTLDLTATETTRLLKGFHFLTQVKLRSAATMPLQVKHTDECWRARPPFAVPNPTAAAGHTKDKDPDGASTSKTVTAPLSMSCETACSAAWTEVDRDMRFSQRTFTSSFVHLVQEAEQRRSILLEALTPDAVGHNLVLSACRGVKCRDAFVAALDGYLDRVRVAVDEAFKPQVALFDMRSKLPDFLSPGSALPMPAAVPAVAAAGAGVEAEASPDKPTVTRPPIPFGVPSNSIFGIPSPAQATPKGPSPAFDHKAPVSGKTASDVDQVTRSTGTFKFQTQPPTTSTPVFAFRNSTQAADAANLPFSFNLNSSTKDKDKDGPAHDTKKDSSKPPAFAFGPTWPTTGIAAAKAASRSVSTPTPSAADAFRAALAATQSGSASSLPVRATPTPHPGA